MEQAIEEHFYNHGKTPTPGCHWCQVRALGLTVVNKVDSAFLPKNFEFINDMVLGKGVEPAEDSFRSGCSCADDGDCQFTGCLCLADLEDDDDIDMNNGIKKAYAYHTHGAKAGSLRSRLQKSTMPLYECHKGCACSSECPNRVVERGRTVPLQIFRTQNRGWGVRSQVPIKQGQFVDRYLGEIITAEEADRRRANSAVSQQKDVYLFALDKFTDKDSLDPRLNGPPLEVDGEFMSGPTRFINHSCDPNLRIFARVGDHADKHIHDLALFAIKDITRGEELTFDYVDGVVEEQDELEGNVEGCGPLNVPLQISVSFVQLWYMDREGCFYFRKCLQPEQRWHGAPTVVGLAIVGYGAKVYVDRIRGKRERMLDVRYQEDRERQQRNDMLLDVYGDRESLEGLEKAIQFYENGKR
ncbi:SET domain protein [Beauveria bassiana ARSEF 2860]|uniref:SET domain protein n=1 Tax=Beauveria bassiana (strain ARSEF 2860) TaxID=655819 RepID=J5J977_BEAB2|nr:SET domain protein [Beauveria bassiana ARSEF 2860]EJP62838.1 SET domain protein [Beauveria bassiana ARSEF 2860]